MNRRLEAIYRIKKVEYGGKPSIINRYLDDTFVEDPQKTNAVEQRIKFVEKPPKLIKLRVCDSVGEERFISLTASFFRGSHAVLFVFDITKNDAVIPLEKWFGEVDRYVDAKGKIVDLASDQRDLFFVIVR